MATKVACPNCGAVISMQPEQVKRKTKCPRCAFVFVLSKFITDTHAGRGDIGPGFWKTLKKTVVAVPAYSWKNKVAALVIVLLICGWILPSMWPLEYAIALGLDKPRTLPFYYSRAYTFEAGFFSKGVIYRTTLEWTHGHTRPVGPWIPGYMLTILVPICGVLGILSEGAKKYIIFVWIPFCSNKNFCHSSGGNFPVLTE